MDSTKEETSTSSEADDRLGSGSRSLSIDDDPVWFSQTLSFPREALFVALVCMTQFCTQAQFFGTLVLLRTIGGSFDISNPPQLAWLIAGFSLTVGTFILFSGRLGDVFGHKKMLVIGYAWFSIWSLIVGFSVYSDFKLAVFARVVQGIGPALCLPNALALFGVGYPPGHRKAMVFAFFGAVAPMGAVFGGAFGSLLSLVWWPWAYWAMGIWLAILAVLSSVAIPSLPNHYVSPDWKNWSEVLDLPGVFIGTTGLILFNFAWIQAPIDGWGVSTVIVPLVLGAVLFAVFAYMETKASFPLIPIHAVNTDVALVLAAMACGWANFGIWGLYLVQILQEIRNLSPLLTTAWFSPVVFSGGLAAILTGKLLGPWNVKPNFVITFALTAFTVGGLLAALAPTDQTYWGQIFFSMLVYPFGMDMSFPAATLLLSDALPKEHQGIGASLVNTVVNYGIAIGVGFAGTVEVHVRGKGGLESHLDGFKGALYMGVGLAILGLIICWAFLARAYLARGQSVPRETT